MRPHRRQNEDGDYDDPDANPPERLGSRLGHATLHPGTSSQLSMRSAPESECPTPTTAFAMVAAKGDIYYGLWYPVIVAGLTFVIGLFFIRETRHANIDA